MADKKNPFNLEERDNNKRGGPDRAHVAHDWTPDEIAEKTQGYLEVAPEFWAHIRVGQHVRYFTKEHGFRPGGFIQQNPFDTKTKDGPEKRFFKIQNGFNDKVRGYASWLVAYEDTSRMLIKLDTASLILMQMQEAIAVRANENIRKITEFVKKLDGRVAALEK